jgi:hypothetical protein
MFLPTLAKVLGSCERAIVLQQIHWLSRLPNAGLWDDDGLHWVWGTYEEWCADYFTMWKPETLKHHIQKLEKQGVLISARLRAHQHDQTKFYRIHYRHELLNATGNEEHVTPSNEEDVTLSNEEHRIASNGEDVTPSLYSTKTSSKNTQNNGKRPPQGRKNGGQRRSYNPADYDDL